MSAALAFQAVTKRYGRKGTLALDDVTWSVAAGTRTALLGPNGSGKSTSIRLLEGALQPTRGRVTLLGAEAGNGADYLAARRRTGIVPQGPGMYTDLEVGEYLGLARRLYGRGDLARVGAAFGLDAHWKTRLARLSGGFQRRLSLAAALLAEPEVLLLDEPTVGLDPVATNDVHTYLREAMRARTALLCTHNLAEAEALCDQVVILRGGRILLQASLTELRARQRPQVRLAARQGGQALLRALHDRGREAVTAQANGHVLVPMDDVADEAPELLRALLGQGLDVYECQPVQPSLEALFLDVVRGDA